jgi:hypothetical protein
MPVTSSFLFLRKIIFLFSYFNRIFPVEKRWEKKEKFSNFLFGLSFCYFDISRLLIIVGLIFIIHTEMTHKKALNMLYIIVYYQA